MHPDRRAVRDQPRPMDKHAGYLIQQTILWSFFLHKQRCTHVTTALLLSRLPLPETHRAALPSTSAIPPATLATTRSICMCKR